MGDKKTPWHAPSSRMPDEANKWPAQEKRPEVKQWPINSIWPAPAPAPWPAETCSQKSSTSTLWPAETCPQKSSTSTPWPAESCPQKSEDSWDALSANSAADGWEKPLPHRPAIDIHWSTEPSTPVSSTDLHGMTLRMQTSLGLPPEAGTSRRFGVGDLGLNKVDAECSEEEVDVAEEAQPMRILLVGLDAAGKSTLLEKLKFGTPSQAMVPTIGYNMETIDYKDHTLQMWDVGGQDKLRPLWKHYFTDARAIIFVVDSSCMEHLQESCRELHSKLLDAEELRGIPLLVFANKQDLPHAMPALEVAEALFLHEGISRQWFVQPTCAQSGDGLYEGLDWLVGVLQDSAPKLCEDQAECNDESVLLISQ